MRVAKAEPDAAPLLHGDLQQPVLASESTWMLSDGVLRLARQGHPARRQRERRQTEWWHGLLEGEDTLDHSKVSVGDYVTSTGCRRSSARACCGSRADHERQVERAAAAAAEAALPASQREGLEKLRAQFPDIPIEYGDTSKFDAAHGYDVQVPTPKMLKLRHSRTTRHSTADFRVDALLSLLSESSSFSCAFGSARKSLKRTTSPCCSSNLKMRAACATST